MAVLGVAAGLVPVAAWQGPDPGTAFAADAPAVISEAERPTPASAGPAPKAAVPALRVAWRRSSALGSPNAGRLVAGVRLPELGPGFYTYNPATQTLPGGADRRWGTDRLVREVITLGRWWARAHPDQPRLGIGDLSRRAGGHFAGPGVGHASHQNGLDVDIRLPRRDGVEGRSDPSTYDRALTQQVVDRLVARGAELVLVGRGLRLGGPPGVVMTWPNHDDHLHVRFRDPDGRGN